MNQVLITENNNPRKNQNNKEKKVKEVKTKAPKSSGDVNGIAKVFAVLILIFGIALSGDGAYAIMQNIETAKNATVPTVEVLKSGNKVKLSIKCETGIRTVSYAWNDSTDIIVQGRGNSILEQTISIPSGENKLNISVIDSQGVTRRYVKTLKQDTKDVTEPTIEFEPDDANTLQIIVTDDKEIDYVTYKYGNDDEVTVRATSEGQTTIKATINVVAEERLLKVEAVDKEQNVATAEQKVKGVSVDSKPTAQLTLDPEDSAYAVLKVQDEYGIRMVDWFVNDQEYKTDPNISLNQNTFEYRFKIDEGETKITLRVYNIKEQVEEFTWTIQN